jgi:hypothetical protein
MFELLPSDVTGVGVADQNLPIVALNFDAVMLVSNPLGATCASIDKSTGITRIVQNLDDTAVVEWPPYQLALANTIAYATGK